MATEALNLFIVDDNTLTVTALKKYLKERFGGNLNIFTFNSGEKALENINDETDLVILDYYLEGKNGNEILRSIKEKSPKTEVIMFSSNENIATAVESFRAGARDYVVKGHSAWKKIAKIINTIVYAPIHYIVKEFHVEKYVAIFFMVFVTMAVVVTIALLTMK